MAHIKVCCLPHRIVSDDLATIPRVFPAAGIKGFGLFSITAVPSPRPETPPSARPRPRLSGAEVRQSRFRNSSRDKPASLTIPAIVIALTGLYCVEGIDAR